MPDAASILKEVGRRMKEFTFPYLAQIFEVQSKERGKYLGSGTFVQVGNEAYLLTAAHVPKKCSTGLWAYSVGDSTPPVVIPNPWQCISLPTDLAWARLDAAHFGTEHRARLLDTCFLDSTADDLDGDILFVHGWPGQLSKELWSLANGIASKSFPYTTVIGTSSRNWFDPAIHIAVDFRVEGQIDELERLADVPSLEGVSGSAVWRTNWRQHRDDWGPHHARVIGVAFDWDQAGHAITCTRIERVRDFVNLSLHREAAYFSWLRRNCPGADDWNDWFGVKPEMV